MQIAGRLADTSFKADRMDDALWHVTVVDAPSGKIHRFKADDLQFGAIMALAVAGDFSSHELPAVDEVFYPLAEQHMPIESGELVLDGRRMIP